MNLGHLKPKASHLLMLALALLLGLLAYIYGGQPLGLSAHSPLPRFNEAEQAAMQPHRALYKMSLKRVKQGSSINNVTGTMLFQWADACDAWTTEQRLDMLTQLENGASDRSKTSLATWEAKDSSQLRFSFRQYNNGKETEAWRGHAQLARDGSGGTADYEGVERNTLTLPPATVFPSMHTLELLRTAASGQRMLTRDVFDGTDSAGISHITAFVGNAEAVPQALAATGAKELLLSEAWPIRLAFFGADSKAETPDYEMTINLMRNGIATNLTIDYGEFVVEATLDALEPLAPVPCT